MSGKDNIIETINAIEELAIKFLNEVNPEHYTEPVNWGDLGCSVYYRIDGDGIDNYEMIVSEASPGGCPKLCGLLQDYILKQFPDLDMDIKTEW